MTRPNLLIIQTDEHNFRTLGCYRDTLPDAQARVWGRDAVVETPNIDWLAQQGALCTRFYATTPICSPSRASFVSGKYPQNTAVVDNSIPMNDDIVTFAECLRREGYRTGYIGKWHLDGKGKPHWQPVRRFGFEDNRYMFNRGHWKKLADSSDGPIVDTGDKPSYDVSGATPENFATDWLTTKAIAFMNSESEKPFCCMLSIPDPHDPNTVRAPYNTQYADLPFETPSTAFRDASAAPSWARPSGGPMDMSQYFGMVKCIDDNVGRVLAFLRESGALANTVVVFTADHGAMCGEHNRRNKKVPLEGSAKVPFVIYYPGLIPGGTRVTRVMGTVDFMPTILGLLGVTTSGVEEGRDASALFTGEASPAPPEDVTFARGFGPVPDWVAAFTSRYKLIVSPADPPWLLDLQTDPDELINACEDECCRGIVGELAAKMLEYGEKYNDPWVADPKMAADLRRLEG